HRSGSGGPAPVRLPWCPSLVDSLRYTPIYDLSGVGSRDHGFTWNNATYHAYRVFLLWLVNLAVVLTHSSCASSTRQSPDRRALRSHTAQPGCHVHRSHA